jgi:hypothetical protein
LLGYPGFQTLFTELLEDEAAAQDPAVVLLAAVSSNDLDPRVVEALPWVVLRYPNLDWEFALKEARRRRAQNRLGYLVSLALRLAAGGGQPEMLTRLSNIEEEIFSFRLEGEDTLCQRVPEADRQWLREARPAEARQWNILTDLQVRDLPYSTP